ncbi:hypothetical protein Tdes44962_MAKER03927 [Teratosphaeria destructans]|uniref:Uncharacterized protein n=1 Tax=Teratosphaeria destructans TaxID=418781 RepID=A0A9W7SPA8_9PEZI|nr:hypothetical protein Tdes44962_MAKER03927 [Teratosphaeria destructans]
MPLSQKQMEYLALAWQCFDSEPKIDYTKFASVANLASANSARELMRVTKKKLKEEYGALSGTVSAANDTPKKSGGGSNAGAPTPTTNGGTGKKRGRKSKAVGEERVAGRDDDDDDGEDGSPSKKTKASPVKKEVVVDAFGEDIFA